MGDEVVALVASSSFLDDVSPIGGLSSYCIVDEFAAVSTPPSSVDSSIEYSSSAAILSSSPSSESTLICLVAVLPYAIKAFSALHYQSRLVAGDSLLLLNAGSNFGLVLAELASCWGVKVLATSNSHDAKFRLERLNDGGAAGGFVGEKESTAKPPIRVIDVDNARVGSEGAYLLKNVLDETNGIGVDCVVDIAEEPLGYRDIRNGDTMTSLKKTVFAQRDIISCLSAGGNWITENSSLQLDPPESEVLFLKGASLSFLFDHWLVCPAQIGRFRHVMREAVRLVVEGTLTVDVDVIEDWNQVVERLNDKESGDLKPTVFKLPSSGMGSC